MRLQYETSNGTNIETFKENVFVIPTEQEKSLMSEWYKINSEENKKISAVNIKASKSEDPVGVLEFQVRKSTEENKKGIYEAGARIRITDTNVEKFHIDMQSWVVTKSGEYLPFIGIYNYTGPSMKYTNSLRDIDKDIKPAYIVAKVVYRDANNKTEEISYFKQKIENINDTFLTDTQVGNDAGVETANNRTTYIVVASVAAVALVAVIVAVSYVVLKKKEDK